MRKIKVGLVGAGFAANIHMTAYNENREFFEVVAVTAKHVENAKKFAERYGIPVVCKSMDELISHPEVDVVDVCVPTNIHDEVILKAAKNGKDIICEKPLTGYFGEDLEDVDEIGKIEKKLMFEKLKSKVEKIETALKNGGVKFMYAENLVYSPAVMKAKKLLKASGAFIMELRAEESHSGSHASYSRRWRTSGGGSLLRMGSHPIGVVLHMKHYEGRILHGKPIRAKSVFAEIGYLTRTDKFKKEKKHYMVDTWKDVEDWSCVMITFEDDTKAVVFSNDISLGGVKNLVQMNTSKGMIYCNITPNNTVLAYAPESSVWGEEYIAEKIETKSGWTFPFPDEEWLRGYHQEMRDFALALLGEKPSESGFQLAKETVLVIYAAYYSSESGRRINLNF